MSAKGQFAHLELLDLTDAVKNLRAEVSATHYDITLIALCMGNCPLYTSDAADEL